MTPSAMCAPDIPPDDAPSPSRWASTYHTGIDGQPLLFVGRGGAKSYLMVSAPRAKPYLIELTAEEVAAILANPACISLEAWEDRRRAQRLEQAQRRLANKPE